MYLDVIEYSDLVNNEAIHAHANLVKALLEKGIVAIRGIPQYQRCCQDYIRAARAFSALEESIKLAYAPDRASGDTEGYESGAEQFQDEKGTWQVDDKKVSYYAFYPEMPTNKWPSEVDLRAPYLGLAALIFEVGKKILALLGLDESRGIDSRSLVGHCRMLHYSKIDQTTQHNPNWCGAHLDHGLFTGLIPAYYFQEDKEIPEPPEAGLYIKPTEGKQFEKIHADDKSLLLFQVGEFGQLATQDEIRATRHLVKKSEEGIERFTFALFYDIDPATTLVSRSVLSQDRRYQAIQNDQGQITYGDWSRASFEQYWVK